MSKKDKLFSLIHDTKVEVAPGVKIVPAEQYSTLEDAMGVLEKVKKDAELYRKEIAKEAEKTKEHSISEGFEEGFKKWTDQLAKLEEEIKKVRADMEKLVLPVALKAAKKIVGKEIELSKDVIAEIVMSTLKAVSQHKFVTIYVNRKELDTIEAQKGRIKGLLESAETIAIRDRPDVEPGGCVIETEVGIINAQMSNRWKILEEAFEKSVKAAEVKANA